MPTRLEPSPELLAEFAEYLETLAETEADPAKGESIRLRAAKYRKESQALAEPADLRDSPYDGSWIRRPTWLESGAGLPICSEPGGKQEQYWRGYSVDFPGDVAFKKALESACPELDPERGEVIRIHFAHPNFLHGVTIAHLERGEDPGWEALFDITHTEDGELEARSFDFKSDRVHTLNKNTPLNCVGHELEYLRFFMYVVRGERGAFRLLEGKVLERARPYLERADLLERVVPTRFKRVSSDGRVVFGGTVLYDKVVFTAELAIASDGLIEMLTDSPAGEEIGELAE